MIERQYGQRHLGEIFLNDSIDDCWEPWIKKADEVLNDEELIDSVYEALRRRRAADLKAYFVAIKERSVVGMEINPVREIECQAAYQRNAQLNAGVEPCWFTSSQARDIEKWTGRHFKEPAVK